VRENLIGAPTPVVHLPSMPLDNMTLVDEAKTGLVLPEM
jgi:hypothetical protein